MNRIKMYAIRDHTHTHQWKFDKSLDDFVFFIFCFSFIVFVAYSFNIHIVIDSLFGFFLPQCDRVKLNHHLKSSVQSNHWINKSILWTRKRDRVYFSHHGQICKTHCRRRLRTATKQYFYIVFITVLSVITAIILSPTHKT